MTIQSLFSFSNIIELSFFTITFIFLIPLVIYLVQRMRYKKCKLVWTPIDFVERRSNLSYEEFVREYASVGKPVIITDAMKNWKASTKWTVDFFRSQYGSVKKNICTMVKLTALTQTYKSFHSTPMPNQWNAY
ncbi:cupin-like domain-containing protein [Tolypothrix sp. VBCCA 56010]|uniref:cupin-like domain-containing protein n=1 Tax=Tolypothrix sp. VBCCA 56010 TaxID=3137731 RepID=UPI003D7D5006